MTQEDLERMVDETSVKFVLECLAQICRDKGAHIETDWQDKQLANYWHRDAQKIEKLIERIDN